jgi:hypothetical protein
MLLGTVGRAAADDPAPAGEPPADASAPADPEPPASRLEALVPELAVHPYHLDPGPRQFQYRVAVSPGFGYLGSDRLFAFRVAYNPNDWLGYEASIGHNPSQSVHAVLHGVSAIVRRPLAGRFQPYLSGGYGMVLVFPGQSLNASPVTKNALAVGGGLEIYIRSDLAVRADARDVTVFGRQKNRDGIVAYNYFQPTIGLSFYRTVRP